MKPTITIYDRILCVICGLLVLHEWVEVLRVLSTRETVLRGFFDIIWLFSGAVFVMVWGRTFLFKGLSPGVTMALLWLISVPIKHKLWDPFLSGDFGWPGVLP